MPRGRPALRRTTRPREQTPEKSPVLSVVKKDMKRRGRPPGTSKQSDQSAKDQEQSDIVENVVKKDIKRRGRPAGTSKKSDQSAKDEEQSDIVENVVKEDIKRRRRPAGTSKQSDQQAKNQEQGDIAENVEQETASPKNSANSEATSDTKSIGPRLYENINLAVLIDGAVSKTSGTIKDLVSFENFQKLRPECQQYLLKLLPKKDCIRRPNGNLEPIASTFKNEYFSAALLDFDDRLHAGMVPLDGEILPLPSRSPSPESHVSLKTIPNLDSHVDSKSSQKLKIILPSRVVSISCHDKEEGECRHINCVKKKYTMEEKEESSSSSGSDEKVVVAEFNLTSFFALKGECNVPGQC